MNLKCRFCLCGVGNKTEFTATLNDDGFCEMLKTVFRFPLPTVQTVSGKSISLPVTVCPPCSTTIRNFYSFTKLTEASQEQLLTEYHGTNTSLSLDELLQNVKPEPDVDIDIGNVCDDEALPLLLWDAVATDNDNESKSVTNETKVETTNRSLIPADQVTQDGTGENSSSACRIKKEFAGRISLIDKRVNLTATKIQELINRIGSLRKPSKYCRFRCASFEITPVNSADELASFNNQLEEKEFKAKVVGWLDANVSAFDSANRMHRTIDLVFSKTFFAECNWTGRNNKVALVKHNNVLELFKIIGSTHSCIMNFNIVKRFFSNKFRHAKQRIKLQARTTSCYKRFIMK